MFKSIFFQNIPTYIIKLRFEETSKITLNLKKYNVGLWEYLLNLVGYYFKLFNHNFTFI